MKRYIEKNPIIMIVIGVLGISLSSIFVKLSLAPSSVTAAYRLTWTVALMVPIVMGKRTVRQELLQINRKALILSCVSGLFLAIHFILWFKSLFFTSVASSTTIVCTEVIWVSLGFCLFLKGHLTRKAVGAIGVTLIGSILIAYVDSTVGSMQLYGDILALLAAIAVAVYVLIGGIVRKQVSTTVYTFIVYGSCAIILLLVCMIQGYGLFEYGWSAVIVGFLLAVFSTILGHSIFSWCLKYFSPSFISASKLCEPVVAAILAIFIFHEMPTILQILGSILIVGGVFYYSKIEQAS